ncbi:MAG: GAF domain-containing protein [Geobacteraceae bacterium]|nr:GAF domain-containing protein [Geobacteraceae bacterium]
MEPECCWSKETVTPEECPYIFPDETDLYASLERRLPAMCLECPRFQGDLERLGEGGRPEAAVIRILAGEYLRQKSRADTMVGFLDSREIEIQFIHEIGALLQSSLMELDEVLSVALTAITAGKGFGMNRAFLLLVNKERSHMKGYLGVGPRNYQEAWEIWEEIGRSDFSLREMAKQFHETKLSAEKNKFHDILERLSVPLSDQGSILNRALRERRPILVGGDLNENAIDLELARILEVDTFLILPLLARNRRVGVILADNFITRKPITPHDIRAMESLTFPVAFAIERASLYERLHEDLRQLTVANTRLHEQQELIIRMEKLALLGRVTSSIAHSIRNPLMIIGGFARSLLKDIAEDDPKKESLETIVLEARLLEDTLTEALESAESTTPKMDKCNINELLGYVFHEVTSGHGRDGISFVLDTAPELPMIRMDYRQMAYCLKKILLNSLDAMSPPGELAVRTILRPDGILVEITDTVSRPARKDGETSPVPGMGGAGDIYDLELSFCRVILENYCKSFTVDGYDGKGTRYEILLPLKKEDEGDEQDSGR